MKKIIINTNLTHVFLFSIIIFFPINLKIISILRPVDLVIMAAFTYMLFSKKLLKSFITNDVVFFSICFIISLVNGIVFIPGITVSMNGYAFIFKYIEIVLLLWIVYSIQLEESEIDFYIKLIAIVFFIIIVYIYLRLFKIIPSKGGMRPDFPFSGYGSSEKYNSAGHLMGSFLVTGSVTIIVYMLKSYRNQLLILGLTSFLFITILLSGSRTPIVVFGFSGFLFLYSTYAFKSRIKKYNFRFLLLLSISITFFIIMLQLYLASLNETDLIFRIVKRSFDFDFLSSKASSTVDASASSRVKKSLIGIDNMLKANLLFGAGVFAYPAWFDNGLVRIMHDFGFIPAMYFFYYMYKKMKTCYKKDKYLGAIFNYSIIAFGISNLSTEFYLVPRGYVSFFILIILLSKKMSLKEVAN